MILKPDFQSFTPKELQVTPYVFEVPLYQRLFSWERAEIVQLLNDLRQAYDLNYEKDYHIGIITVVKKKETENTFLLVDGQQRMTVLMLLGCVSNWCDFLYIGKDSEKLRVTYFARESDSKDIKELAQKREPSENVKNINMRKFFSYWNDFIKVYTKDESAFKEYVFRHMRVMISELPQNYVDKLELQNQYFEKLNSAGRQLEPHEILKTKIGITGDNLKVWNGAMDFSKPFTKDAIPDIDGDKITSASDILKLDAPPKDKNGQELFGAVEKDNESTDSLTRYAPIDFSMFLLHILDLYLYFKSTDSEESVKCWGVKKLLDTFHDYILEIKNNQSKFIEILKTYRLFLDENIIHILQKDGHSEFRYWCTNARDKKYNEPSGDTETRQFQSMLYVSSNEKQEWILEAYRACASKEEPVVFTLDLLKKQDRERHKVLPEIDTLLFHKIEYYWFYRLDYELWERRKEYFKEQLEIANCFVFKKRNSVEHIKPQTNLATGQDQPDHRFGNLALITSSENSKLSNNLFGTKKELLSIWKDSFPSLKLLHAFANETWGDNEPACYRLLQHLKRR